MVGTDPTTESHVTGFAALSPSDRRAISSLGGRAAQARETAHRFTAEEQRAGGLKSGHARGRDQATMKAMGRKGGLQRAANRIARLEASRCTT